MIKKLAMTILLISPLHSEIKEIKLKISGFVNKYCAEGVIRKLARLSEIKNVKVSKKGSVKITLDQDNKFNILKLKPVIEARTNYKIKSIKIVASGTIERVNNYYRFAMKDNPNKIFLGKASDLQQDPPQKSGLIVNTKKVYDKTMNFFKGVVGSPVPDKHFAKNVRLHCKHNAPVKLTGRIHSQADGSIWLSDNSVKMVEIEDDSDLIVHELNSAQVES